MGTPMQTASPFRDHVDRSLYQASGDFTIQELYRLLHYIRLQTASPYRDHIDRFTILGFRWLHHIWTIQTASLYKASDGFTIQEPYRLLHHIRLQMVMNEQPSRCILTYAGSDVHFEQLQQCNPTLPMQYQGHNFTFNYLTYAGGDVQQQLDKISQCKSINAFIKCENTVYRGVVIRA